MKLITLNRSIAVVAYKSSFEKGYSGVVDAVISSVEMIRIFEGEQSILTDTEFDFYYGYVEDGLERVLVGKPRGSFGEAFFNHNEMTPATVYLDYGNVLAIVPIDPEKEL